MNRILPNELPQFLRRYRIPGGRLKAFRVIHTSQKGATVEFRLIVHEATKDLGADPKRVRLKVRLAVVEEYRFQMRPNQPKIRITDARISYLNGLFYVNLDAWSLEPGEQPRLHDFRASEVYAGGRELYVEEILAGGRPKPADQG
jgi:hypothetical protein